MKRLFTIFLTVCMLLSVLSFAACGETPAETTDTSATGTTATQTTEEGGTGKTLDELDGYSKHPDYMDVNFGGKEFRFAVQYGWSGGWDTYEVCAEMTGNDNLIDEAVAKRNSILENLYNCKISQVQCSADYNGPHELIANDISLGVCNYEFCMPLWQNQAATSFYNIYDLDVDLTHSWWNQSAIDAFSVKIDGKDRLYVISGYFNLIAYDSTMALLVNKSYYDQLYSTGKITTDVFQAVRDGKWTMDMFMEVAAAGTSDANGDQALTYDGGDIFGCTDDGNYIALRAFYYGAGIPCVRKTDTGSYEAMTSDNTDLTALSDFVDKLVELYNSGILTVLGEENTVKCIATGQSLFNPQYIYRLHSDDDEVVYGVDYGDTKISVVPFPKATETQENYYSYVMNRSYGLKVSKAISDPSAVSQFMEVYAFHSAKIVYPDYVKCLKTQCLCDDEAGEMLEIILDSRMYDFGTFGGIGLAANGLTTFAQKNKNTLSRAITGITNTSTAQIDEYIKNLKQIS